MSSDDAAVAPLVRKAAAWSWRLLIIAVAAWVLLQFLMRLGVVIVPAALALMLTALLVPAVDFLSRRGAPRGGAVALVLICGLALVGSILAFVITQFADGLPDLADQVTRSIDSARQWLIRGPLHLRPDQINHFGDTAIQTIRDHQQELTSGALSTAGTVTEIVTGALLALFTLIFLLLGGRNIWRFLTQIAPATPDSVSATPERPAFIHSPATCVPRLWSPSLTPSASAPAWPSWESRWRCRWHRWCFWAPSFPLSARCCPDSSLSWLRCWPRDSSMRSSRSV